MIYNNFMHTINIEELENSLSAFVLTDSKGVITWTNEKFKKNYQSLEQIDKNFESYFGIKFQNLSLEKSFQEIQIDKKSYRETLRIFRIISENNELSFLIEIIPSITNDILIINKLFGILLNDNNLREFCSNVLLEIKKIFGSEKELIVILEKNQLKEIIFNNVDEVKINLTELSKIIKSNLLTLNKWFLSNKKTLLSENDISSIGYQINQILESNYLFITPSISLDKISTLIIFSRKDKVLEETEFDILKTYSNLLAIGIDLISARENYKLIENRLANAQKLETVGKLASGMAHDFNNLLASIFGSINLLRNRVGDNPNTIKLIDNIENSSIRARDLIKGMLSFGKPTQLRKEIVLLDNVLNELLKVVNHTFPKHIKIISEIDNFLYKIIGSSTELYQIVLNLCINAKEAIKDVGTISIKAENIRIDDSNIFLFPFLNKGHYVKISVIDNGVGIDEENLSKIFEPYFSTKQKDTGSGLGLFVTSELVKAMNGYIEVESKVNEGTSFRIYFPAISIKEQTVLSTKEKIIMLADDEEILNDLLGDLLESNGFYVLKVNNTKEVFRILTEEVKVDLLIIDYNLPEITGLECVSKLREMDFNMPVILASGATNLDDDEIRKAKINFTLPKPYEFETLLETIKKLLHN